MILTSLPANVLRILLWSQPLLCLPSRFAYSLVDNEDADDDESVEQGTNKNFGESMDNAEPRVDYTYTI